MRNYKADSVDSYIASADKKAQPTLCELRSLIKSTIPGVEEKISWGVPFYRYHGLLAGFSVFTNHVSFGLTDILSDDIREKLEKAGYKTGKKIVQIKFDQKIPEAAIKHILTEKAKSNQLKSVGVK